MRVNKFSLAQSGGSYTVRDKLGRTITVGNPAASAAEIPPAFLTGDGVPSDADGSIGDTYFDNLTKEVYTKATTGWLKKSTLSGEKGKDVLTGEGPPAAEIGNDGESYIDTQNFKIHRKSGGSWSAGVIFKGIDGSDGAPGERGDPGEAGKSTYEGTGDPNLPHNDILSATLDETYLDTDSFLVWKLIRLVASGSSKRWEIRGKSFRGTKTLEGAGSPNDIIIANRAEDQDLIESLNSSKIGDLYLDTTSHQFYKRQLLSGFDQWVPKDKFRGTAVLEGAGDPDDIIFLNAEQDAELITKLQAAQIGDLFLDTTYHRFYKRQSVEGSNQWIPRASHKGDPGVDGAPGADGEDGQNAVTGYLTNETHTITAYSYADGKISDDLPKAGGKFNVMDGQINVTNDDQTAFDIVAESDETVESFNDGANGSGQYLSRGIKDGKGLKLKLYTAGTKKGQYVLEEDEAGSWKTDSATFALQAIFKTATVQKIYTITKSKSSSILSLKASTFIFNLAGNGSAQSPTDVITLRAEKDSLKPIPGAKVKWEVFGVKQDGTENSLEIKETSGAGDFITVLSNPVDLIRATVSVSQFVNARSADDGYASIKVAASYDGVTDTVSITPAFDGIKGDSGQNAISGYLTNESQTITAYSYADGKISDDLEQSGGKFEVLDGRQVITNESSVAFTIALFDGEATGSFTTPDGDGISISRGLTDGKGLKLKLYTSGTKKGAYELEEDDSDSWKTDSASFTLVATVGATNIQKTFTISKSKSSSILSLQASTFNFNLRDNGEAQNSTDKISFRADKDSLKPIAGATVTWKVYGVDDNGDDPLDEMTMGGNDTYLNVKSIPADLSKAEMTVSQFRAIRQLGYNAVKIEASYDGVSDFITINPAFDGAKGADGEDGADAITGYLTNESHSITAYSYADGKISDDLGAAGGFFTILDGKTDVTSQATFTIVSAGSETIGESSDANGTYKFLSRGLTDGQGLKLKIYKSGSYKGMYALEEDSAGSWKTDGVTFTIRATYNTVSIDKTYTIVKSKSSSIMMLIPTTFNFSLTSSGGASNSNDSITFKANKDSLKPIPNAKVTWRVFGVSNDGTTTQLGSDINNSGSNSYLEVLASPADLAIAKMSVAQFRNARSEGYWSVRVLAEYDGVSDDVTISPVFSGAKGDPGVNAISGYLTNESFTITAYSYADGKISDDLPKAGGKFNILDGTTDVTSDSGTTFNIVTDAGETLGTFTDGANGSGKTLSRGLTGGKGLKIKLYTTGSYKGKYVIEEDENGSWKTDSVTFSLSSTRSGTTITKNYVIVKSKSQSILTLRPTSLIFNLKSDGAAQNSGDKIGFKALKDSLKPIAGAKVSWEVWGVKADGTLSTSALASMSSASVGTYLTVKSSPVDLAEAEMTVAQYRTVRQHADGYVSCQVKATYDGVSDVITITPAIDGSKGDPGVNAISGYLTNESSTITAYSYADGKISDDLSKLGGKFKVLNGTTDVTDDAGTVFDLALAAGESTVPFSDENGSGKTLSRGLTGGEGLKFKLYTSGSYKGKYRLEEDSANSWKTDSVSFDLTATSSGTTITKTYTISKSKSQSILNLRPTSLIFNLKSDGTAQNSGDKITLKANKDSLKPVAGAKVGWEIWGVKADGSLSNSALESISSASTGSYLTVKATPTDLSTAEISVSQFRAVRLHADGYVSCQIKAAYDGASDIVTISPALDGVKGDPGKDPVVGYLTNEACTIPALVHDSGKLVSSAIVNGLIADAGGSFKLLSGTTDVSTDATTTFTIEDDSLTSDVVVNADNRTLTKSGLMFKIYTSGVDKGKYELSQNTKWTSNSENFTVKGTYNGVTVSKIFSIVKNFSGSSIALNPTSYTFNLKSNGTEKNSGDTIRFTAKIATAKLGNANGTVKWKVYGVNTSGAAELIETATSSGTGTYINVLEGFDNLTVAEVSVTKFVNIRAISGKSFVAAKVEALFDGDQVTDAVTIYAAQDGAAGIDALTGYLTNEAHVITAYSYADGKISDDLGLAGGKFNVLSGTTDVTLDAGTTFEIETAIGETLTDFTDAPNGSGKYLSRGLSGGQGLKLKLYTSGNYKGKYVLEEDSSGSWKTDSVTFSLKATRSGSSISKTYTITKVKSNSVLTLRPTSLIFNLKSDGTAQNSGDKISFRALKDSLKPIANAKVNWEVWGVKADGTTSSSAIASMSSASVGTYLTVKSSPTDLAEAEMTVTQFASIRSYVAAPNNYVACIVKATYDGISDSITINPAFDGATGAAGKDSVTGYLTNESFSALALSGGNNKLVASIISSNIITGSGGRFRVVSGITDVTESASATITYAISDSGGTLNTSNANYHEYTKSGLVFRLYTTGTSTRGNYELRVTDNTSWSTKSETFTSTATYNGVTVTKTYSISKNLSGVNVTLNASSYTFALKADGATAKNSGDKIRFTASIALAKEGNATGKVTWTVWGVDANGADSASALDTTTTAVDDTYLNTTAASSDLSIADMTVAKFITALGASYKGIKVRATFDGISDDVTIYPVVDGAAILQGAGAPSSGTGVNGDVYLDTTNHTVYKKSSGTWSSQGSSYKGADGSNGNPGADAIVGYLTNESFAVPALSNGKLVASSVSSNIIVGSTGQFKVLKGATDVSSTTVFTIVDDSANTNLVTGTNTVELSKNNLKFRIYKQATGSYVRGDYELVVDNNSSWSTDSETFTVTGTPSGSSTAITKIYTISKNKTNASVNLAASAYTFSLKYDGAVKNSGDKIKLTSNITLLKEGNSTGTVTWQVYAVNSSGTETEITPASTYLTTLATPTDGSISEMTSTQFKNVLALSTSYKYVKVKATFDSVTDEVTLQPVLDGTGVGDFVTLGLGARTFDHDPRIYTGTGTTGGIVPLFFEDLHRTSLTTSTTNAALFSNRGASNMLYTNGTASIYNRRTLTNMMYLFHDPAGPSNYSPGDSKYANYRGTVFWIINAGYYRFDIAATVGLMHAETVTDAMTIQFLIRKWSSPTALGGAESWYYGIQKTFLLPPSTAANTATWSYEQMAGSKTIELAANDIIQVCANYKFIKTSTLSQTAETDYAARLMASSDNTTAVGDTTLTITRVEKPA